jgi:hypothetical protein
MISEAMQALYAGERERAESLLTPGRETVFEAAAFGRDRPGLCGAARAFALVQSTISQLHPRRAFTVSSAWRTS